MTDAETEVKMEEPKRRGRKPKAQATEETTTPIAEPIEESAEGHAFEEPAAEPGSIPEEEETDSKNESRSTEETAVVSTNETGVVTTEPVEDTGHKVSTMLKKVKMLYRAPRAGSPICAIKGPVTIESGIPKNGFIKVSCVISGMGRVEGYVQP